MNLFFSELITPPAHLPVTVAAADQALGHAVVEELEKVHLWRAIVAQERRIRVNGPLPPYFEIEPLTGLTSITRWTEADAAEVIPAATYSHISSDPLGATIFANPGKAWPVPLRPFGSFSINYECGFTVTPESAPGAGDAVNEVPASIQFMVNRAIAFRAGSGLAGITIGSLTLGVAKSYSTDQLPREITSIGRSYAYRPGIFSSGSNA